MYRCEIWADGSKNYLVCKLVNHVTFKDSAKTGRLEANVVSFREVKPGIFFPDKMEHRNYSNGKEFFRLVTTLSEIRVNEKFPEGVFTINFPEGALVTDKLRGVAYKMGPNQTPAGKPARLIDPTASAGNPLGNPASDPPGTQTPLETPQSPGWIMMVVVLIGGFIALLS